jgi:hypothetical protein
MVELLDHQKVSGQRDCNNDESSSSNIVIIYFIREVIPGSKLFIGGYIFVSLPH